MTTVRTQIMTKYNYLRGLGLARRPALAIAIGHVMDTRSDRREMCGETQEYLTHRQRSTVR